MPCHLRPAAAFTSLGRAEAQGAVPPIPRAGLGLQLTQSGCTLHMEGWKTTYTSGMAPSVSGVFPRVPVGVTQGLFPAEQDMCLELGQEGPELEIL